MIARLKVWALAALAGGAALFAAFLFGKRDGKKEAKIEQTEGRLEAVKDMKEIKHEVDAKSDDALANELNGWVRK